MAGCMRERAHMSVACSKRNDAHIFIHTHEPHQRVKWRERARGGWIHGMSRAMTTIGKKNNKSASPNPCTRHSTLTHSHTVFMHHQARDRFLVVQCVYDVSISYLGCENTTIKSGRTSFAYRVCMRARQDVIRPG